MLLRMLVMKLKRLSQGSLRRRELASMMHKRLRLLRQLLRRTERL